MPSASVGDKDPKETLIDTGNGVIENAEENVVVSSRHFATHEAENNPVLPTRDHPIGDRLTKWSSKT